LRSTASSTMLIWGLEFITRWLCADGHS